MTLRPIVALALALVSVSIACGPPPEPGPPGPVGPPGPPGTSLTNLSSQRICFNSMKFDSTSIVANHFRTDFEDGSVMVTCGVYPSQGEDTQKWSPPLWYKKGTPEADTGYCFVYHTLSTPDGRGGGLFEFSALSGAVDGTVTYKHLDGPYDGTTNKTSCQPFPRG